MNILDTIVKQKQKEIVSLKKKKKDLIAACEKPVKIINFKEAVSKPGRLNIIGEVKYKSPSAGVLKKDFKPLDIADIYKKNGISAISVLTDEKFFGGKLEYLKLIKKKVGLPVLRKDFIIDDYQIYESYLAGADAVLLIAGILSEQQLKKFINLTAKLGMSALVETHTKDEIHKALSCGAWIIGINNRNLKTFKTDLKTTGKLLKYIPKDKIVVSESGIKSRGDILYLKKIGVNAALIGETFMKAADIKKKVKLLVIKK